MAAGLVDRVQVTLFPVITGRTGLSPIFQGAVDFDLELIENRTLDGRTQELESHRRELEFDAASTIGELLTTIRPDASIMGGRATWLVILGTPSDAASGSAVPVGVCAQEWAAARLFGPSDRQLGEFPGAALC